MYNYSVDKRPIGHRNSGATRPRPIASWRLPLASHRTPQVASSSNNRSFFQTVSPIAGPLSHDLSFNHHTHPCKFHSTGGRFMGHSFQVKATKGRRALYWGSICRSCPPPHLQVSPLLSLSLSLIATSHLTLLHAVSSLTSWLRKDTQSLQPHMLSLSTTNSSPHQSGQWLD